MRRVPHVALVLVCTAAEEVTLLLQQKLVLRDGADERRRAAEPISWLHFPKAGSSFINAIVHLPGVCPGVGEATLDKELLGDCWLTTWNVNSCAEVCRSSTFTCPTHPNYEKHPSIGDYAAQRGKLMSMFREPDQRILSGYHDDGNNLAASDYAEYLHTDLRIQDCTYFGDDVPKRAILDFAEAWKGGMAYQIVVDQPKTQTLDPQRASVTRAQALEAARRVREGFAFVGLTEHWELSMCLFHKMFGGPCRPGDFEDTRPSSVGKSADVAYDVSELSDWHDDLDELVYDAAKEVFHQNLLRFNVSQASCQECYQAAGRL